jgi:hypothetical protein
VLKSALSIDFNHGLLRIGIGFDQELSGCHIIIERQMILSLSFEDIKWSQIKNLEGIHRVGNENHNNAIHIWLTEKVQDLLAT